MVIPFNISCGQCWMCRRGLYAQCETTQVREQGKGAALFGYTSMPMMEMFDRGISLRMGQAHVKRWIDDLLPMVRDGGDPLGVTGFATHHLPLEEAPHGYEMFRNKTDGCIKVVLRP